MIHVCFKEGVQTISVRHRLFSTFRGFKLHLKIVKICQQFLQRVNMIFQIRLPVTKVSVYTDVQISVGGTSLMGKYKGEGG